MSGGPVGTWTSTVTRAAITLLFVGVAAYIVWWLVEPLLPMLLVLLVLIGIYRLALGWFRRGGW